jgi:hypothetical protein
MAGASMVTAQDDIADDDKHENDGADDDFYTQMADYDLAMTNALY